MTRTSNSHHTGSKTMYGKKVLSVLLTVVMLIGCFGTGFTVFATETIIAQGECGSSAHWKIVDDGTDMTFVVYGTGDMWSRELWTGDSFDAWDITKIVIEEGITSTGFSSFGGGRTVSESVEQNSYGGSHNRIASSSSSYTKIFINATGNIVLPTSIERIGDYSFYGCSGFNGTLDLSGLTNLTTIGTFSFAASNGTDSMNIIGSIVIPDNVTTIGSRAFYNCSKMAGTITLGSENTHLQRIENGAFNDCKKLTGDLVIPNTVTYIGNDAFMYCSSLDGNLTIGDHVEIIGDRAFYSCSKLKGDSVSGNLIIPDSVTTIGSLTADVRYAAGTFFGCTALTGNLVLGDSVVTIGNKCFSDCSNLSGVLEFPDSLRSIGKYAFSKCYNISGNLEFPDGLIFIGQSAFDNCCRLSGTLELPNNNNLTIEKDAFHCAAAYTNNNESFVFNGNLADCNTYKFFENYRNTENSPCFIEVVAGERTEPADASHPGNQVYKIYCYDDSHKNADTGEMQYIDSGTNKNLIVTVYEPIGYTENIIAQGQCGNTAYWKITDDGTDKIFTVYGTGDMWQREQWIGDVFDAYDITKIVIDEGITSIGNSAFGDLTNMASETQTETSFGGCAPNGDKYKVKPFKNATECILPNTLTSIGNASFQSCIKLSGTLNIPSSVTRIGYQAFAYCTGLTGSLIIPDSVITIGNNAFRGCTGLTGSLVIGTSVQTIGSYAFSSCNRFTGTLVIPDSVTSIGTCAFHGTASYTNGSLVYNGKLTDCNTYKFFEHYRGDSPDDDYQFIEVVEKSRTEATPSQNGNIVYEIYCTDASHNGTYTNSNLVTTVNERVEYVSVSSITVIPETLALHIGDAPVQLAVIVAPDNATNQNVSYTSSDPNVVTVSSTGLVTVVGAGTATITVAAADGTGSPATISVSVTTVPVSDFTITYNNGEDLNGKTLTMRVGDPNIPFNVQILPNNATQPELAYESSGGSVAVTYGHTSAWSGNISAMQPGTTVVTLTTTDGTNISKSFTVNVLAPVDDVKLVGTFADIKSICFDPTLYSNAYYLGDASGNKLTFASDPFDADKTYLLSLEGSDTLPFVHASDPIDPTDVNGYVFESAFVCGPIVFGYYDGSVLAVTIGEEMGTEPVLMNANVSFDCGTDVEIFDNETLDVDLVVYPEDASYTDFAAVIEDPTVATYSNDKITGIQAGTTKLIVTLKDDYNNNFRKEFDITVNASHVHNPGEPVHENDLRIDNSEIYLFQINTYCQDDGELLTSETVNLDKTAAVEAVPSTDGNIEYFTDDKGNDDPSDDVIYIWDTENNKFVSFDGETTVHYPGTPIRENDVHDTANNTYSYDLVTYCDNNHDPAVELGRETVTLTKHDAVEPQVNTPGTIEYYENRTGDKFVWDNNANKYVPAPADLSDAIEMTKHDAVPATAEHDGNIEYYTDPDNNKYTLNADTGLYTPVDDVVTHFAGTPVRGNDVHDTASNTYSYDLVTYCVNDHDPAVELNRETVTLTKHDAVDPTANTPGNVEYYEDGDGNKFIYDGEHYVPADDDDVTTSIEMTLVPEKDATDGHDGNDAYYEGSDGKIYVKDDNDQYVETTLADVTHHYPNDPVVENEHHEEGNYGFDLVTYCDNAEHDDSVELDRETVTLTKHDAVDPTANTPGNVEYYEDGDGNKFIYDGGHYVPADDDDVTTSIEMTLVPEKDATDGHDGNDAYYEGSDGKIYVKDDNDQYVETTLADVTRHYPNDPVVENEHHEEGNYGFDLITYCDNAEHDDPVELNRETVTLTKHDAVEPTANTPGNIEYYEDDDGNKFIYDGEHYVPADDDAVSTSIEMTFVPAVDPTDGTDGHDAYYEGSDGKLYVKDDNDQYVEIAADDITRHIPGTPVQENISHEDGNYSFDLVIYCDNDHDPAVELDRETVTLTKHDEVPATANTNGNVEYFTDDNSTKYIWDETVGDNGAYIQKADAEITTSITMTPVAAVEPTDGQDGHVAYYDGSDGKKYVKDDEGLYAEVQDSDIILHVPSEPVQENASTNEHGEGYGFDLVIRCANNPDEIISSEHVVLTQHEAVDPANNEPGQKEYFTDSTNNKFLYDADSGKYVPVLTDDELVDVTKVDTSPADDTHDAVKEHYVDNTNGDIYIKDDEGNYVKVNDPEELKIHNFGTAYPGNNINDPAANDGNGQYQYDMIEKCGHDDTTRVVDTVVLTKHDAVDADPNHPGNTEYFEDNNGNKYVWSTEDGGKFINATDADVTVAAVAVNFDSGSAPSEGEDGVLPHYVGDDGKFYVIENDKYIVKTTDELVAHLTAVRKDNETAPTCTSNGFYDEVTYCINCGKTISSHHVVVKGGHSDEDEDGYCDVCNEEISWHCSKCNWFNENKDKGGVFGIVVRIVHMLVHMIESIHKLT